MALTKLTKGRARWLTFKLKVAKAVSRALYDKLLDQGISVKDFGAKGDGVTDDTDAIQATLLFANPFKFNKTVYDTNTYGHTAKYKVWLPQGVYRITKPLIIDPHTTIEGVCRMGWFSCNRAASSEGNFETGSIILADFNDTTAYALTTANFDETGVRQINKDDYRKEAQDQNKATQANAVTLKNMAVLCKGYDGSVKGAINLCLAHESTLEGVHTDGFLVGVNLSTSWGGEFRQCNIQGRVCGITGRNDITSWNLNGCYISAPLNNQYPDFEPPRFSNDTIKNMTACISGYYANFHINDCILEGAEVAVRMQEVIGCSFRNNYHEKNQKYAYAFINCSATVSPAYWVQPTAKMLWCYNDTRKSVSFDIGNCAYEGDSDAFELSGQATVEVTNNNNKFLGKNIVPRFVTYSTYSNEAGYCDIYVDPVNGVDTNHGYSGAPVATFTAAMNRLRHGLTNRIQLGYGSTVETTYIAAMEGYSIEVLGYKDNHSRLNIRGNAETTFGVGAASGSLKFKYVDLYIYENVSVDTNYQAAVQVGGSLALDFEDCFIGASPLTPTNPVYLLGGRWKTAGSCSLTMSRTQVRDITLCDQTSHEADSVLMWSFNHSGCTFQRVDNGESGMLIKGRAYNSTSVKEV